MAFHIVTNRCFLACEKVTSIVLEELAPELQKKTVRKSKSKNKKAKVTEKAVPVAMAQFAITISYYPLSTNIIHTGNGFSSGSSRSDQENSLEIRIKGKEEANRLYKEIVKEVQEQHPSEAYLDKLVGDLLEDNDVHG